MLLLAAGREVTCRRGSDFLTFTVSFLAAISSLNQQRKTLLDFSPLCVDNDTHFKLPSLGKRVCQEKKTTTTTTKKKLVEEREAKNAAFSRAALPCLATPHSLDSTSPLVSQVSKAAFMSSPVSPGCCRTSRIFLMPLTCVSMSSLEYSPEMLFWGSHGVSRRQP